MDSKHISLEGRTVFLSSSVPNPWRSPHYFRISAPDEIRRAVLAFFRSMLRARAAVAMGGHPSVAPAALEAAETEPSSSRPRFRKIFRIYQSEVFLRNIVSNATQSLFDRDWATVNWTPRVDPDKAAGANDMLRPGMAQHSLKHLRETMLRESNPAAGVFIGGMEGVEEEAQLFQSMFPDRPLYFISSPGGAAAEISHTLRNSTPAAVASASNSDYTLIMEKIAADLMART